MLDEAVADERLSPVERARIDAAAAALDISVMDKVFVQITESGT